MSANGLANRAVDQLESIRNNTTTDQASANNNSKVIDDAISALSTYIPAEAMALYLAITSSLPAITTAFPSIEPAYVFWFFVFLVSPGLFLLAYYVKLAKNNSPFPSGEEFPKFRLVSSIIAFGVWGLCVPDNPYLPDNAPGAGVLYGVLASFVSVVLPGAEAIYNWVITRRNQ